LDAVDNVIGGAPEIMPLLLNNKLPFTGTVPAAVALDVIDTFPVI
jgi:hypothetical protein